MSNTSSIVFFGVLALALIVCGCQKREQPTNQSMSSAKPPAVADGRREEAERTIEERPKLSKRSPARAAPPLGSIPDPFSAIDKALNETGNIAFNAPRTMNKNDTVAIKLLLSLAKSMEELKGDLSKGNGVVGEEKGANIQVRPRMEARLSANFQITAVTPEEQLISRTANTEWDWEIKPREIGKQSLHLTLSAIMFIDGSSSKRALRTFDEIITVEVTPGQRVVDFVTGNWQWLWAVIVVPVGTFVWQKRRKQPELDG